MTPAPGIRPGSATRLWCFRLLAGFGLPVALVVGLEGTLRLTGYGRPSGFLIPDEKPGWYRSNPDYLHLFMPESFALKPLNFRVAVRKPANRIRIVVLGESAAQGVPAPEFGLAPQLRAQLRARYPGKEIEVINTGMVAVNSHVVYQVARELAGFEPDLFVVYLGNNEVVGPYGPGCAYLSAMPPLWIIRLSVFVRATRTGQLISAVLGRAARPGSNPVEWGGMTMFAESAVAGDDPRLEAVYRNFETNLRDILGVARAVGAKTVLGTVVSNLQDCAPLLSRHRPGLAGPELAEWQGHFDRGRTAWLLGEDASARAGLEAARRLDPHHADTLYLLGTLALHAGETEAARAWLVQAQHWDALRFRPDPQINAIIRRVARGADDVRLFDAAMAFGSDPASSAPIAGRELLFEHVHLQWEGNYRLARALAQEAEAALTGIAPDRPDWLGSAGCAAALGSTPPARPAVLRRISALLVNPPFTNQLTYPEDQARLAREMNREQTEAAKPETLRQAQELIATAVRSDPDNPDLAKLEAEICDARGDLPGALAAARRSRRLQPRDGALAADEVIKLCRLGRLVEAEELLRNTAAASPAERTVLAPAWAELLVRTRRWEEGRRQLGELLAARPSDQHLRLLLGRVEQYAGNEAGAEREFRKILAADPAHRESLEALVGLLTRSGRQEAADQASLAAVAAQPRNHSNNLRAAILAETRGDRAAVIRLLLAAERSGPVNAALEMHLAGQLYQAGQADPALAHLATARRLALIEGDAITLDSVQQRLARLQAHAGPAR